jgi:ATP-dependent helicase HrpA
MLPQQVTTASGARAWPALIDQQDAVGLRLYDTWEEAVHSHAGGVLRLLALNLADKAKYLRNHHGLERESLLAWSQTGSAERLIADLFWRCLLDTVAECRQEGVHDVRSQEAFAALLDRVRSRLGRTAVARAAELNDWLPAFARIAARLGGSFQTRRPEVHADLVSVLEDLVYPGFLTELENGRLAHYPRYLQAIGERLDQLEHNPLRDSQRQHQIEPWWRRYVEALESGCMYDEALDAYRWLLHEYRVSIFAQPLGTAEKVSPKRLAEAWTATGIGKLTQS